MDAGRVPKDCRHLFLRRQGQEGGAGRQIGGEELGLDWRLRVWPCFLVVMSLATDRTLVYLLETRLAWRRSATFSASAMVLTSILASL